MPLVEYWRFVDASLQRHRHRIGGASYRIVLNRDYRYTKQHCASGPLRLYDI